MGDDVGLDELVAARERAAEVTRRLINRMNGERLSLEQVEEIAATVDALLTSVGSGPRRSKVDELGDSGRVRHFVETGEWPAPPADGEAIEFDRTTFIGGRLNPATMGTRYHREGRDAVGIVTFTETHEGPPERAHGGAVAAVFDEVMGSVLRVEATLALTGSLTVRYSAPAPLGVETEFRARIANQEGRRIQIEAEATGPDGPFATAQGTFIEPHESFFTEGPFGSP